MGKGRKPPDKIPQTTGNPEEQVLTRSRSSSISSVSSFEGAKKSANKNTKKNDNAKTGSKNHYIFENSPDSPDSKSNSGQTNNIELDQSLDSDPEQELDSTVIENNSNSNAATETQSQHESEKEEKMLEEINTQASNTSIPCGQTKYNTQINTQTTVTTQSQENTPEHQPIVANTPDEDPDKNIMGDGSHLKPKILKKKM